MRISQAIMSIILIRIIVFGEKKTVCGVVWSGAVWCRLVVWFVLVRFWVRGWVVAPSSSVWVVVGSISLFVAVAPSSLLPVCSSLKNVFVVLCYSCFEVIFFLI